MALVRGIALALFLPPNYSPGVLTAQSGKEDDMTTRHALCESLGFLLASLLMLAFSATASATETIKVADITVLVFNFRQVPDEALVKAENETRRILQQAGVRVAWRDCPTGNEPCYKGPGRVFILAVMAGQAQNKFMDTVSGYAVVSDHLAVVYYDDLPRMPAGNKDTSDAARVLGCVIAHELGHLLLGVRGHSVAGIMQANWGVEQTQRALMDQLFFLPEEARLMQASPTTPTEQPKKDVGSALLSQ